MRIIILFLCILFMVSCEKDPYDKPLSELSLKDIEKVKQNYYDNVVKEREEKYVRENEVIVAPPPPPLVHYDLPTSFKVKTKDAEPHFIKTTISLGHDNNSALSSELVKKNKQFQNSINVLLSEKKYKEIDSTEEKINLSEEIKKKINAMLSSGKIREVYFRELIVK